MKLRRGFPLQQLLFLSIALATLPTSGKAQDVVVMRDGKRANTEVLSVVGTNVEVKVGAGSIGVPLANIVKVEKAPPPAFTAAVNAYKEGKLDAALAGAKAVSDKFAGLPVAWAQQALGMLGEIYLQKGDMAKAESAFREFKKKYPGKGSLQGDIGMARLAVANDKWSEAKTLVKPVTEAALADKAPTSASSLAYGQAFYVMGQIKQHDGDLQGALLDYLRTVTVFHEDGIAASDAKKRADELRKEHPEVVVR